MSYSRFGKLLFSGGRRCQEALKVVYDASEANGLARPSVQAIHSSPSNTVVLAEALELLGDEAVRVGVEFVWEVGVDERTNQQNARGQPCPPHLLQACAPLLVNELQLYPTSFFCMASATQQWMTKMYINSNLTLNGEPIGGFALAGSRTLCLNVSGIIGTAELDSDWWPSLPQLCIFKQVFHHEMFHLLDVELARLRGVADPADDDPEWKATNPDGFVYVDQQRKTSGSEGYGALVSFSLKLDSGPFGFMCTYQTASMLEDKGCLAGNLFAFPGYVKLKSVSDSAVAAKVALMKAVLYSYCSDLDDAFWNRISDAKYARAIDRETEDWKVRI